MKIQFKGHQATNREVELSQQELHTLFDIMKEEFLQHITYSTFGEAYSITPLEKAITKFCDSYGVDSHYDKDRISFFTALLNSLKNPYQ